MYRVLSYCCGGSSCNTRGVVTIFRREDDNLFQSKEQRAQLTPETLFGVLQHHRFKATLHGVCLTTSSGSMVFQSALVLSMWITTLLSAPQNTRLNGIKVLLRATVIT